MGAIFSAARTAAGSAPLATAPDSRRGFLARLFGRQGTVATYGDALGRRTAPALPVLQDVHLVTGPGDFEAKALQFAIP